MKRYLIVLILFTTGCSNKVERKKAVIKVKNPFTVLYEDGPHFVRYFVLKQYSASQKKLLLKFKNGIEHYPGLLDSLTVKAKAGLVPVFNTKMGLKRAEFDSLVSLFAHGEYFSGSGQITIRNNGNGTSFYAGGKLSVLDSLLINRKNNMVFYRQVILSEADSFRLPKTNIPEGEELQFAQMYSGPGGLSGLLKSFAPATYTVCIARLSKSGNILIDLSGEENTEDFPKKIRMTLIIE